MAHESQPLSEVHEATKGEAAGDQFDLEAAIASFLADPSRTSLELPHMTTGQRKNAKRVADQHSELRCESYGFGADRKLHLFKNDGTAEAKEPASQVRVKNTFIDDWVSPDAAAGAEGAFLFRSMPEAAQMARLLQMAQLRPPPGLGASDDDLRLDLSNASTVREEICHVDVLSSGGLSTSASITGESGAVPSSPTCSDQEPVGLPDVSLSVRNTFIHIDGGRDRDREIQSMPHGMFSQCLKEEIVRSSLAAAGLPPMWPPTPPMAPATRFGEPTASLPFPMYMPQMAPPVAPPTAPPIEPPPMATTATLSTLPFPSLAQTSISSAAGCPAGMLCPGMEVVVEGLLKAPAFNGKRGMLQSFDEVTGRYNVILRLDSGAQQPAKIKGENLRAVFAQPSPYSGDASRQSLQLTALI